MATRSLTEVFILMRNNAMQNRHLFSEQVSNLRQTSPADDSSVTYSDDRTALVSHHSRDVELGINSHSPTNKLPPEWIDGVEEVQYEISRIKQKWKELSVLHDKHLNRPTLDDSVDEEHAIEIQTREITQMFSRCQRLVQQICAKGRHATIQEQKVTNNITNALARTLTELSTSFRQGQSSYLRKLKNREERSNRYFQTDMSFLEEQTGVEDDVYDRGFTDVQLTMVEDNSMMVQQREKEIAQIVRSIHDLNEIFKDLATFVVDQVYPTTMRALGLGTCSGMSRIGAIITPFIAQVMLTTSPDLAVNIYGGVALVAAICALVLPIETRGREMRDTHHQTESVEMATPTDNR